MTIMMVISLAVAALWNKVTIIKDSIHHIFDPSFGVLLDFNVTIGMLFTTAVITLVLTLFQKYGTDQEALREIKKEQKILQAQIKEFKDNPAKVMELNKKNLEFMPRTMELTMAPLLFTALPIILFFRWFNDYFMVHSVKILGFLSWFWAYLIFSIIFSMIFRKLLKVA